jgi:hypothetical protein
MIQPLMGNPSASAAAGGSDSSAAAAATDGGGWDVVKSMASGYGLVGLC